MGSFEKYTNLFETIKNDAVAHAVDQSEACWRKFPSKRKSEYNNCCKQAAHVYHVFCDGKRRLKSKLKLEKLKCEDLNNPTELRNCKLGVYESALKDLYSLQRKINREKNNLPS